MSRAFQKCLTLKYPIIQAPMAGVTTIDMAAKACLAGAMASLPLSHLDFRSTNGVELFKSTISQFRECVADESLENNVNLNFFCHDILNEPTDPQMTSWIKLYKKTLNVPIDVNEISFKNGNVTFKAFERDNALQDFFQFLSDEWRPKIVSFHFGHPSKSTIKYLQKMGICIFATATSVKEVRLLASLGINGIVCQGYEAGGHRGNFLINDSKDDENLSTIQLVKRTAAELAAMKDMGLVHDIPYVIAAGGIMDAKDISYALSQQADAVQLGTALLGCTESNASENFSGPFAQESTTRMVDIVSGKPARTILTPFIENLLANFRCEELPPYGYAYNAFKQIKSKYPELANFILAGQGFQSVQAGITTDKMIATLGEKIAKY
ncbi:putative nitronate monooxygenase SKDI_10G3490 [Saccharomyces kudriavzevii IFO 1802]|uniref:YJR149W-like protein n=2 Tax=Saccharomyces kudriavzevii (strain ATCC MYA-4449 / AS 2.2408 / CBS 8840 / NBRC 1802 / NCYC 2889) TaxID=226230 RepID=J8THN7_SACK1|nr:uncharacterized protein SKDI_10G3490 [Saccharomyces kudriavzevii IFO 1802]EJT44718.1 YJR149W-like protein [Saccharomyces kudriavzevii IFO 1802]CAI4044076.1 hypothetical protein SKDI_10G3490 [Saccharomyces kudriavzevii IFO 1802]